MVRIPKVSESVSDGYEMPAEGSYTAVIEAVEPPQFSEMYGNNQQLFKWKLLTMFDEEEEQWTEEFADKDKIVFDYVNVDKFTDGGGDPTRVSTLYKIAKAILGPELDPEDAGDTDDFVNRKAILELLHGVKKLGPNAGKPKLVIANYKYIKRKKTQAKPDVEMELDVEEIPF
jgi:hypothetical protein